MMTLDEALSSLWSDSPNRPSSETLSNSWKPLFDEVRQSEQAKLFVRTFTQMSVVEYMLDPEGYALTLLGLGVLIGVLMEKKEL